VIPKPVAFRPTEKVEQLIFDTMKAKGFEAQSDALNYLLESSQTPQIAGVIPLSTPQDVEQYHSDKLPASLDRELQHFFNGRDSPLIALVLSDVPRKKPELVTAITALHDNQ